MKVTMTVRELREKLAEFDSELRVFADWEGVHAPIVRDCFSLELIEGESYLTIDVNAY